MTHGLVYALKIFGEFYAYNYNRTYKSCLIVILFLQLVAINLLLGNWVYDQTPPDTLDAKRGIDWEHQTDWIHFNVWLQIEIYVFYGSLLSGVIYMFIRAFIPQRHEIKI